MNTREHTRTHEHTRTREHEGEHEKTRTNTRTRTRTRTQTRTNEHTNTRPHKHTTTGFFCLLFRPGCWASCCSFFFTGLCWLPFLLGFLLFFEVCSVTFGLRVAGRRAAFFFLSAGLFCLVFRPGCWASCCSFFSPGFFWVLFWLGFLLFFEVLCVTFWLRVLGVVLLFFFSAGFFAYFFVLGAGRRAALFSLRALLLTFSSWVLGVVLLFFSLRAFLARESDSWNRGWEARNSRFFSKKW